MDFLALFTGGGSSGAKQPPAQGQPRAAPPMRVEESAMMKARAQREVYDKKIRAAIASRDQFYRMADDADTRRNEAEAMRCLAEARRMDAEARRYQGFLRDIDGKHAQLERAEELRAHAEVTGEIALGLQQTTKMLDPETLASVQADIQEKTDDLDEIQRQFTEQPVGVPVSELGMTEQDRQSSLRQEMEARRAQRVDHQLDDLPRPPLSIPVASPSPLPRTSSSSPLLGRVAVAETSGTGTLSDADRRAEMARRLQRARDAKR